MSDWRSPLLDLYTRGIIRILKSHLVEAIVKAREQGFEYKTVCFETWATVLEDHYTEHTWPVRKEKETI